MFAQSSVSDILGMHYDIINSIELSPDDQLIITGSSDCSVIIWKVQDIITEMRNKPLVVSEREVPIHFVGFICQGKQIAAASMEGKIINWDITSGKIISRYSLQDKPILSFSISPSRKRMAAGSSDGTVTIWDF